MDGNQNLLAFSQNNEGSNPLEKLTQTIEQMTGAFGDFKKQQLDDVKALRQKQDKTDEKLDSMVSEFQQSRERGGGFEEIGQKIEQSLEKVGDIGDRLDKLEGDLTRPGVGAQQSGQSLGAAFIGVDDFKAIQSAGSGTAQLTQAITGLSAPGSGNTNAQVYDDRRAGYLRDPDPVLRIADLIPVGTIGTNAHTYRRSKHTFGTKGRKETQAISKGAVDFTLETAPVVDVGELIDTTEEVLRDETALASEIDYHLTEGMRRERNRQVVHGQGGSTELEGLMKLAEKYKLSAGLEAGEPPWRQSRAAILNLRKRGFRPSSFAMSPDLWAVIELTVSKDGIPIISAPSNGAPARIWGVPVFDDDQFDENEWLLGDFRLGSLLLQREGVQVTASTEHNDNFGKRMVSIRATERYAHPIYFPKAFEKGPFIGAPTSAAGS